MRIGIDGNEANIENRVGVNVYAFHLLHALRSLSAKGKLKHEILVYLRVNPRGDMPKETKSFKYKVVPGKVLWVLTSLMKDLVGAKPRPDVFFSPSHYVPLLAPVKKICSIMDLGYLENSGQFTKKDFWQLKYWTASSIYISKYVISISEATKRHIVRRYPFAKGKVFVTPLAHDASVFNTKVKEHEITRVVGKFKVKGDYALFLSTLKPSKNIEGILASWVSVKESFPAVKLVIAGKKGWLYDSIFEKVKSLGLAGDVIFTDYVPEDDIAPLMAGARVFVQPSFWEGFGLVPLEAMATGTPVVVSSRGSLTEVVGDAGEVVDPKKPEEIAGAIKKILGMNKKEYNRLVERSVKQANKFSWEETAKRTIKVFEKVA